MVVKSLIVICAECLHFQLKITGPGALNGFVKNTKREQLGGLHALTPCLPEHSIKVFTSL